MRLNPIDHDTFTKLLNTINPFGEDGDEHGNFLLPLSLTLGDAASTARSALIIVLCAKMVNPSLEELEDVDNQYDCDEAAEAWISALAIFTSNGLLDDNINLLKFKPMMDLSDPLELRLIQAAPNQKAEALVTEINQACTAFFPLAPLKRFNQIDKDGYLQWTLNPLRTTTGTTPATTPE